ncbi:TetR/AcrR family transcriptional regulator [Cryobacterium arcticum]|uniref:TetR family transcriptional regulator n=1 Tax=Cryobacterium arcticum TaxID=670052 RepID=A0A317ZQ16_9MICO|nr:TetR/AcrR family transcriptional regulator [Cryobacterium arcticum]PXA67219.1 TetR family transcriptional regulator [Cryobacterium arcticum]
MARTGRFPKGAARREAILQTATDVLSRDGFQGTSLRAIGRELEVEPAHILYYFDSREDLIQNVIARWDDSALESIGGGFTPGDTLDNFAAIIRRNLEIPGLVHLYLVFAAEAVDAAHPAHAFFRNRYDRVRDLLSAAVRFEQATGRIPADVDADRAARMLLAVADGVQQQALMNPAIDAPADLEALIDQLRSPRRGGDGVAQAAS